MTPRIALAVLAALCALAALVGAGEVDPIDLLAVSVLVTAVAVVIPDRWHP